MPKQKILFLFRWAARITGTIIILFWGAFFMEHLEWLKDLPELPPGEVLIMMFFHLLILLGYLAAFKYEIYGSVTAATSAVIFFRFAAGENFIIFTIISSIPAVLYILCRMIETQKQI